MAYLNQRAINRIEQTGGSFYFENDASIAASDHITIEARNNSTYTNMIDYAPFDAVSVDNNSAQDIECHINKTHPGSGARFIVPRQTVKTFDLVEVVALTIKNRSSTTAIGANEVSVVFIKNAFNSDILAEKVANRLGPLLGKRSPIFASKRF